MVPLSFICPWECRSLARFSCSEFCCYYMHLCTLMSLILSPIQMFFLTLSIWCSMQAAMFCLGPEVPVTILKAVRWLREKGECGAVWTGAALLAVTRCPLCAHHSAPSRSQCPAGAHNEQRPGAHECATRPSLSVAAATCTSPASCRGCLLRADPCPRPQR